MSSRDLRPAAMLKQGFRRAGLATAVILLPLLLAGCFRPLNGPTASGASLEQVLSGIIIDEVPDRLGHFLVEELRFNLNGSGIPGKPVYRLAIKTTETVQTAVVNSATGVATSAAIIGTASFTLKSIETDEEVTTGTATASASYTRNEQRYASVRAARDAQIRVATLLAEQIRTRLAAKLASRS